MKDYGEPQCGCTWCERLSDGVHLHQIIEGFLGERDRNIAKTEMASAELKAENQMLRRLLKAVL